MQFGQRYMSSMAGLLFASLLFAGPSLADGCQFVSMVDPDSQYVQIYTLGSTERYRRIDLRDGGSNRLNDIDFSRVPGQDHSTFFVTQGSYLRVVGDGVERTIHVANLLGLEGLNLTGIAAADAVETSETPLELQYALYLTAKAPGHAYFIVMDQKAILDGLPDAMTLIAHGELCVEGQSCSVLPGNIAVGAGSPAPESQVAFTATMNTTAGGVKEQQFYRITRGNGQNGPFTVTLDPWNQAVPWDALRHRHLGVDIDARGEVAVGAFQTEGQLIDMDSGTPSCTYDGNPIDVALWGPAEGFDVERIQFVATEDDDGSVLAASPWLECPEPGDPLADEIVLPGAGVSVGLSSREAADFWVYVGIAGGTVKGVHYLLSRDDVERLNRVEEIELSAPGTRLAIGPPDPAYATCPPPQVPTNPDPPVPCCLDPEDPDPGCDDCTTSINSIVGRRLQPFP